MPGSVEQAVSIALQNNPDLIAAQQRSKATPT
jgi:hypothetical protein